MNRQSVPGRARSPDNFAAPGPSSAPAGRRWVADLTSSSAFGTSAAAESIATSADLPGADQQVDDLQPRLAVVGLGDQELVSLTPIASA